MSAVSSIAIDQSYVRTCFVPEHEVICGDCLDTLKELPDASVDLVFGSPPYEDARTYGMGFNLKGQDWVDWMVERCAQFRRVSRGLVALVVAGKTKGFQWSATPALLMADLHRAGFVLRSPPVFGRVGIPGSGGPDWLRNDYEFIVCFTHERGELPWSDNTACGHEPKYPPGGSPSHRTKNGGRVGRAGGDGAARMTWDEKAALGAKPHTKRDPGKTRNRMYLPPAKANPGNVINCVALFDIYEILVAYAILSNKDSGEVLRDLRNAVESKGVSWWFTGVAEGIFKSQILQSSVQGRGIPERVSGEWSRREAAEAGEKSVPGGGEVLCRMREDREAGGASCGRGCDEQLQAELDGPVPVVPQTSPQESAMLCAWMREEVQGSGILRHALPEIQKAWESARKAAEERYGSRDSSDIIHCVVGGGRMGSPLAHFNEAPFPTKLAEFFIKSFCPPGGRVLDPFAGSGTTAAVAKRLGRKSLSIEIRETQVDLIHRRLKEVEYGS